MAAEEGRQQQPEPLAMPVAQSTIDREALVFTYEVRNVSWVRTPCFALRAKRSLICCSSALFSSRTLPSSFIDLLTSAFSNLLNSSMCTIDVD